LNFLVDENEKKGSIVFTGKIKIIYPLSTERAASGFFFAKRKKKNSEKKKQNYNRNKKNTQFFPLLEFLAHPSN
jgi:hypothetical protein